MRCGDGHAGNERPGLPGAGFYMDIEKLKDDNDKK
jgi:hypothetical protein